MRANPKVTLLAYDPCQPLRYLEARGQVVEMTEAGAREHLDQLAELYTGKAPYFGQCVPEEYQERETPVLCKILPTHIVTLPPGVPRRLARLSSPALRGSSEILESEALTMPLKIPESHLDLLIRPIHGVLTTMMPDGQPQSSLVWCDYDGEYACVNTTRERQKGQNMQTNPKVTLLIVDPDDTVRYIEIRGEAVLVEEGALEHLNKVTREYTRHPQYYGYIYPAEQRLRETRIICRIKPKRITLDAIHK
jgi:PPOX class probable F420-dependent enzyme